MEIRVTLFLLVQFCICYIVYVQSMCVPILRSIDTKLTKKICKNRVLFDVTLRHASWRLDTDRYFDKEHFETNQKSLRLPVQKLWLK